MWQRFTFNTYGYNYFKKRDLAAALSNANYAYNVEMEILGLNIHKGESNDVISDESLGSEYAHAVHSNGGIITLDDDTCKSVECFNINGYNYYKIRDIADVLGFKTDYDNFSGKIVCE